MLNWVLTSGKIDFEGTISQNTLNRTETKSQTIYMPMLYVGIQIKPISLFALEIEARGIGNGDNHYYDYIGRLRINPIPWFLLRPDTGPRTSSST